MLARYMCERVLQQYNMVKYLPSTIAAASVYLARKSLRHSPWSPTLLKYAKYAEDEILPCAQDITTIMGSQSSLQAVKKKFTSSKYGSVANIQIDGV